MKARCTNKRCGYEGYISLSNDNPLICPCCSTKMIESGLEENLSSVEKNMMHCVRLHGKTFVFSEIDKIENYKLRCHNRKVFQDLIKKLQWENV